MVHADLVDAFNDCVDRLHAGVSLEECLRQYPDYADTLRSLLQTTQAVRHAEPELSLAARARMRSRVMQSVPALAARAPARPSRLRGLTQLAAVLVMVLFAGLLIALFNRDDDPMLHLQPATMTMTPTLTVSPTMTETATPTQTATVAPTQTPVPTESAPQALIPTATATGLPATLTPTPESCSFTVAASSVNLRSGPGTGYSVVDYAYAGDALRVSAQHTSGMWYRVDRAGGPVWIAASVGSVQGACDSVPVATATFREGATGEDAADDGAPAQPPPGGAGSGAAGDDSGDDGDDDGGDDSGDDGDDDGDAGDDDEADDDD